MLRASRATRKTSIAADDAAAFADVRVSPVLVGTLVFPVVGVVFAGTGKRVAAVVSSVKFPE